MIDYLKEQSGYSVTGLSVDVNDLYYSLPHDQLLKCFEDSIDAFGAVAFQNNAGVSLDGLLELLSFYLKSTYAEWDGDIFLQKQGVCIGSCIATIISDLYLAAKNRKVALLLEGSKVTRVFGYMDDFLVLFDANGDLDTAV